jgi:hypothetical protein
MRNRRTSHLIPQVENVEPRLAPSGLSDAMQEIAQAQAAAIEAVRSQNVEMRGQIAEIQQAGIERDLDAARQASEAQVAAGLKALSSGQVVLSPVEIRPIDKIEIRPGDPPMELQDQPSDGRELYDGIPRNQDALNEARDTMQSHLELLRRLNEAMTG